jgi:Flp pilus assembly protein TadD
VETRNEIPGLRAGLGWFSLSLRDLGQAREIFLRLARTEGYPEGFHGLAALLLATGRVRDARVIMERLSLAYPRDPVIQVNRGMVLAGEGGSRELAGAAVAAKRALTLDTRLGAAHTCLGIIAFMQGRLEAAETHFAEAIRLSDPVGQRNMGLLACAREDWGRAEPHLLRATRLDPLDARAWAGLGAVSLHTGRTEEALLHLRRAGALDPRHTGIARGLAIALARSGDGRAAEEAIRRTLGLVPEPGRWVLLLELAALLVSDGGPSGNPVLDEEAKQVLAQAGAIRPGDPGILFYEGVVRSRLGRPKEAMERFASSMGSDEYCIPAHENVRRIKKHLRARGQFLRRKVSSRSLLAVFSLFQLAAAWSFFVSRLLSEITFVLLIIVFSLLFAVAVLVPALEGETKSEIPLDLVIPERTFIPSPEAEMALPFVRLRTALRPRTESCPRL